MKSLGEIKIEQEKRHTQLFNDCGLFWAFSDEQFNENKTTLQDGEKYVAIGSGGYMPKHNVEKFKQGMKDIAKWRKMEIKSNKLEYQQIAYELSNHECYYTGDISDVVGLFSGVYTVKQIQDVYNKERGKHLND